MRLSLRTILSLATLLLLAVLLWLTRNQLLQAWQLLFSIDLWVLSLFIPAILLSYYAAGEMVFSYLRQKGSIKHLHPLLQMRLTLEMNFVNHVLPSGGASGVSYMTWRLTHNGVSASRAAMAQVVRFVVGFAAFSALLVIAVLMVTIDGSINRWMILVSSTLVSMMVAVTIGGAYALRSPKRLVTLAGWFDKYINGMVRKLSSDHSIVSCEALERFLLEIHEDYLALKRDYKTLWQPFIWGVVFTCAEVAIFYIAFLALGETVNPAPILIAYGLATLAGFAVLTPGGSGAYEALMVSFLVIAGTSEGVALAGVVLSRVLILLVIIAIGYIFYQAAIIKHGKRRSGSSRTQR